MCNIPQITAAALVLALAADSATILAQVPNIVSISPMQNELNVPASANISVTFDVDMDATTINDTTFVVNARSTGVHEGFITYDSLAKTATFDPNGDFDVGEVVTVTLTTDIQSREGIALASSYVWSFTVAVNGGVRDFVFGSTYLVWWAPRGIFAADLDGDADLDIVTANELSGDVSVLFNNGDGTFADCSNYPAGGDSLRSVFAADFDGDGDLDLATANRHSNDISVLLNDGDGTFAPPSVYAVGSGPLGVFAADLDGDGDLDLAAANGGASGGSVDTTVSILLNNGDGTFADHSVFPVDRGPQSVIAADLDGDADLDLATPSWVWHLSHSVCVLFNNGDATYAPYTHYTLGEPAPLSIYSADLDGDRDMDLISANLVTGDAPYDDVSVLLNQGDGSFAPYSSYSLNGSLTFTAVCAADIDGDGDLDLVIVRPSDLAVLQNYGDGTFDQFYSAYSVNGAPASVFAADFDSDGDLDLASANWYPSGVSILLNHTCGDIDGGGRNPNVADLTYLAAHLFDTGPPPPVTGAADVDGSGPINVADLTYLVEYLFFGGSEPRCAQTLFK